jgi:hypothetical protein
MKRAQLPETGEVALSSTLTSLYRSGLPLAFLGVSVLLVLGAALTRDPSLLAFALAPVLLAAALYFPFRRVRYVLVKGDTLYVEHSGTMICLPLSDIEHIDIRRGVRPPIAFIYLRRPAIVGSMVMFIPVGFNFSGRNPLLAAVLSRALATAASQAAAPPTKT